MRFKSFTLFVLLAFCALGLHAQTEHLIKFDETTHDFGTVDQNAKTETVFRFKNVSQDTVRLTFVKAGCGCTTPKWTQEVVQPGQFGEISVSYNSSRVGAFDKPVTVKYNNREDAIMLTIKGNVLAAEGEDHAGHNHADHTVTPAVPAINYGIPRGAVSFEKMIENIKSVTSEETQFVEFRLKNTSGQDVKFLADKSEVEPGLSVAIKDQILKPGQESTVKVTIDGKKLKAENTTDGFFSKRVTIVTDEAEGNNKKQLSVNGNYTRVITEAEKSTSPKIEFETIEVNGGKIIEGEKFVYDFKFKNTGNAPLVIESAKASCGCTATAPPVESIQPGGHSAITATFDSKGRIGVQSKSITVKSNDVSNSIITLKFTVEVVKDPFHAGSMMGGSN